MYFKELKQTNKSVFKIAHSADIHIRNNTRHNEYKKVFKNWYKQLKEEKPDLIVLVGDIIHSKTTISPEVVEMVYNLFLNLSKISDVIIIPGNHDINLSNLKRKNILSAVKKIHKIDNVFLLEKSGVYRYNNIDFYHCSLLDNNHPKEIYDNKQTNIALWHGTVDTSINKYHHEFRSKINIKYFDMYDYTFLGDIHKKQKIQNNERIQYPGSLISQDFGEESEKGYLIWDLNEGKSTFKALENPNTFYTIYIRKNKIENLDIIKTKNPRIRIFIDDISLKYKNKFINDINKICKPIEISVLSEVVNYNTNVSSNLRFNNFYDITVQNKLLKMFLKQRYDTITEDDINKVLNINQHIEDLLMDEGKYILPKYNSIWNLEKIEFSNLFRYNENNVIDFNNISDITGIFGKNSSGKTSIFDIIFFALYGRTTKKINLDKAVNDKKMYGSTKIYLKINNVDYIIERKVDITKIKKTNKRRVSSNKLDFYKLNNDEKILLNADDKNKTEKNIRKLIGQPDDFLNTTMIPQNRSTKFIQSASHRKSFISQMIGLEAIQIKFDKAKTLFRKKNIILEDLLEKKLKDKFGSLVNIILNLNEKIIDLESDKKELNQTIIQIEKDIKIKQLELNNLNIELFDITELNNNKNEKINTLKRKENKLNETILSLKTNKESLDLLLNKIIKYENINFNNIEKRFNDSRKEINLVNRNIEKLKYIIQDKLKQIKILDEQPWCLTEEICKKCNLLKIVIESKNELLSDLSPQSEKLLKEKEIKNKKYKELESNYYDYKDFKKFNDEINSYKHDIKLKELKVIDIEKEIKQLNIDIENIDKNIELYYQNEKNIKYNIQLKNKIHELETLLKSNKKLLNNISEEITNNIIDKKTNENEKNKIAEELHKIERLDEECCYYKYYIEAMDKDNIPLQIIKDFLPEINKKITGILEGTVPFSIQIEYDGEDDLSIMLIRNDGDRKIIESEGGMANVIAGIALRVALLELSSLPKSTLFAIDEQFSALDDDRISSISNLFNYIKRKFKNVLLITHITNLKDEVDTIIDIHNNGKYSHVEI